MLGVALGPEVFARFEVTTAASCSPLVIMQSVAGSRTLAFWTKLYFPFITPLLQETALNTLPSDRNTLPEKCQQPFNSSQVVATCSLLPRVVPTLRAADYVLDVHLGVALTFSESVVEEFKDHQML